MTFNSTSSIMAGDRANGGSKNGRGEQFSKMPIDLVLSVDGLSNNAKLVYAAILKWDWGDSCFAGHKKIAEVLRRSERTIKRGLKELKDVGLVSVKQQGLGRNAVISVVKGQDRSEVTPPEVTTLSPQEVTELSPPYNITDDLGIDDLETDNIMHGHPEDDLDSACGCIGYVKDDVDDSSRGNARTHLCLKKAVDEPEKSKREIITHFYRKNSPDDVSKSFMTLGIGTVNKLQKMGYSLRDVEYAAKWARDNCSPRHFGLVEHTIGMALEERERKNQQERKRQELKVQEEERERTREAKLKEEQLERERQIDRSPHKNEWDHYKELIRKEIKHQSYLTWFSGLYIDKISEDEVALNVPNLFMAEFIEENYDKLLRKVFERDVKLQVDGGQ